MESVKGVMPHLSGRYFRHGAFAAPLGKSWVRHDQLQDSPYYTSAMAERDVSSRKGWAQQTALCYAALATLRCTGDKSPKNDKTLGGVVRLPGICSSNIRTETSCSKASSVPGEQQRKSEKSAENTRFYAVYSCSAEKLESRQKSRYKSEPFTRSHASPKSLRPCTHMPAQPSAVKWVFTARGAAGIVATKEILP